jgi:hypothetical protein
VSSEHSGADRHTLMSPVPRICTTLSSKLLSLQDQDQDAQACLQAGKAQHSTASAQHSTAQHTSRTATPFMSLYSSVRLHREHQVSSQDQDKTHRQAGEQSTVQQHGHTLMSLYLRNWCDSSVLATGSTTTLPLSKTKTKTHRQAGKADSTAQHSDQLMSLYLAHLVRLEQLSFRHIAAQHAHWMRQRSTFRLLPRARRGGSAGTRT